MGRRILESRRQEEGKFAQGEGYALFVRKVRSIVRLQAIKKGL
jgi:hypothetical protein